MYCFVFMIPVNIDGGQLTLYVHEIVDVSTASGSKRLVTESPQPLASGLIPRHDDRRL